MNDNAFVHKELFRTVCGAKLGAGMSREVYACTILPDVVVKVEDGCNSFQNIMEWQTWRHVKDTPASRWFAACRWISPCGSVLIMERTRPAAPHEFPAKLPAYLTDTKRSNYGFVKSKSKDGKPEWFVCHDYGTNLLMEHGRTKRERAIEWWDEK